MVGYSEVLCDLGSCEQAFDDAADRAVLEK
jgi:hypothetical protein